MAIVKMKRLRLIGMTNQREQLLLRLQRLGSIQVDEAVPEGSDPQWQALARPDGGALTRTKDAYDLVKGALELLDKFAPHKTPFLSPKPTLTTAKLLDKELRATGLIVARTLADARRRLNSLYAEQAKYRAQQDSLVPWLDVDVPLDSVSTQEVSVVFGAVWTSVDWAVLTEEMTSAAPLSEFIQAGRDKELQYFVLICHKSVEETAMDILRGYGFNRIVFPGMTGTARDNEEVIARSVEALVQGEEQLQEYIAGYGPRRELLKLCADQLSQKIQRERVKANFVDTEQTYYLNGWVTADGVEKLEEELSQYTCAWELADPTEEEYEQVPVRLKNNIFTRPLNMVTEMYSLPAYNGVDPNPLMAPFFVLFYGIMMADMGYGLLMVLVSVIGLRRMRPKGGVANFLTLLGLCGTSTFVVGAMTGGFFGDFIPQLLKLVNPESTFVWFWQPLFTPLDNTLEILIGAMALGGVHIITGMAVGFVKKIRDGRWIDAVWEELTWWIVMAGIGLALVGISNVVLIVGGVMVLVGAGWDKKGLGKVAAIFGSLYNHLTGYFGDILSYSRLMALMLAGSVIAQVFNTLGAVPGNIFIFLVISIVGNSLNFGLNLLGCFVHDLRLQCLEYFGKFYEDGGKPFQPLEHKVSYFDLANE